MLAGAVVQYRRRGDPPLDLIRFAATRRHRADASLNVMSRHRSASVSCLVLMMMLIAGHESALVGEVPGAACDAEVQDAPLDFKLADIDGAAVSLATFKGSVILLNFWATWC